MDPREQPVAPEPAWDVPPPRPFNRERFLLLLVAWILGVQFGLLILAGAVCGYGEISRFRQARVTNTPVAPACPTILEKIKESAGESLAVLLALLGGGTVAVGEYQRRHPPQRPQAAPLPEPEPWDVPPPRPMPPVMPATDPRAGVPLDPRDPRNRPPEDEPPLVGPRQGR
jgi:hypothetical protein